MVIWTFQVQFQLQIILNRINVIADNRRLVRNLKIGTIIATSLICVSVFCIWIPAHMMPTANPTFILINKYWDKIQKAILCIIDAGLNYYFLRTVKLRLVNYYGLRKYAPLVSFNAKLIVFSVGCDVLLIAVMLFSNNLLFTQFQALVYIVKLNIELSMASLIARLARGDPNNDMIYGFAGVHQAQLTNHSTVNQQPRAATDSIYIESCGSPCSKVAASVQLKERTDTCGAIKNFVGVSTPRYNRDIVRHTDLEIVVGTCDGKTTPPGSDSD